ncbi:MAG TPA: branched-chain amino acid ABC transporter permease, partial [Chloroflexota bacterium]|nr:branched-chain amino acid ABC transporter permease [Chloroflexota bacterium]
GQPSLGNAAFFAVGGYSLAIALARYAVPFWPALLLALIASAASGLLAGLPALRVQGAYLAVVTLALVFITQDLLGQYEAQTVQASSLNVPRPSFLAGDTAFYYVTLGLALLVLLLARNLLAGRGGRALVALRESEPAATMLGVPAGRARTMAFVLSAIVTGLAGALQALQQGSVASSSFGLDLSVLLLGTVVIGGLGSLTGAVVGGCLVAGLSDLLRYKLPGTIGPIDVASASPIVYSLLIIGAIALFPSGVAGALSRGAASVEGQ